MSIELGGRQKVGLRTAAARFLCAAAGRLDGVKPAENGIHRAVAPIHIISDFNNDLSPVECEQKMRSIFGREGVLYEAPHKINDIQPFNITDGAFQIYQLVNNQRCNRIPGIFVGVVDPGVGSKRRGIVVTTYEGYTFVGPDNGLFSPTLSTLTVNTAYEISEQAFARSSVTFHGRDQFSPIAAEIATGRDPSSLSQLKQIDQSELVSKEFVAGQVVENDGYGNLKLWHKGIPTIEGRRAKKLTVSAPVLFRDRLLWFHSLRIPVVDKFEDVAVGQWLVYEGSSCKTSGDERGLIELAIRDRAGKNGAGERLGVNTGYVLKLSWRF